MPKSQTQERSRIYIAAIIIAIVGGICVALITSRFITVLPNTFFPTPRTNEIKISGVAQRASQGTVSIIGKANGEKIVGSGFIISPLGYVVTCAHVVGDNTAQYSVVGPDGKTYHMDVVGRDTQRDLALLKVHDMQSVTSLPIANSEAVQKGDVVITVGNPFGLLSGTITTGIVSGIQRNIVAQSPDSQYSQAMKSLIQIDAPINPGESGGPVLNSHGEVIGVSEASDTRAQNISFAIPSNSVKEFIAHYDILKQ